jgi:hypothetical protein
MSTPTPIPRRRWLPRFGLRTLLIAVTAICAIFGAAMLWYRAQVYEYHSQQAAADRIKACGGNVQWKNVAPTWWPFDKDVFQRITSAQCGWQPESRAIATLNELSQISSLESVWLLDKNLDDAEFLDTLKKLSFVQEIWVSIQVGGLFEIGKKDEYVRKNHEYVESRLSKIREQLPSVNIRASVASD